MWTRFFAAVALACSVLVVHANGAAAHAWAVDPADPGPSRPSQGLSLFDQLTADGVPFPFEALVRRIEREAGCRPATCVTSVLVPLGRSLQRMAAAPDFFAFPRVVSAATADGDGRVLLKDRLYLGYQERAGVIEVISYNEVAARFEFQLVRNYRARERPETVYASRAVCTACHQNHGPIFSRQQWDETNANPAIAAKLALDRDPQGKQRYGVAIGRGVGVPNSIDDSTDRANLFAVAHRIWRDACDGVCRSQALQAALQYRLSHEHGFDVTPALAPSFVTRWPHGLAVPNPDLPNRDPLLGLGAAARVDVDASFEALNPRAPIEVWSGSDPLLVSRFIAALATLIADADVRDLNAAMVRRSGGAARRTYRAQCTADGARHHCTGEVGISGTRAAIDRLSIGGKSLTRLQLRNGRVSRDGTTVRTAGGDAIESIELPAAGKSGIATVKVVADFAAVRVALDNQDWSDASLSRSRVRSALGLAPMAACCGSRKLAVAPSDVVAASSVPPAATAFVAPCAACHRTAERSPPNFLAGDAQRISDNLAQCAPRMFVRLSMWQVPLAARAKVPMPPPRASHAGTPLIQSAPDSVIVSLQAKVAEWLRAESGQPPDLDTMLARGYENLRPCLQPAR